MNVFRNIFIVGIAVTFYLLILEWQKDYITPQVNSQIEVAAQDTVVLDAFNSEDLSEKSLENSVESGIEGSIKNSATLSNDLGDLPQVSQKNNQIKPSAIESKDPARYISVQTDTLDIKIDLLGGDIVQANLKDYPVSLEQPDVPFVLLNNGVSRYIAQSGLIGKNKTDLNAKQGRPLYKSESRRYKVNEDEFTISLKHVTEDGLYVTKQFTFKKNDYLIGLSYQLKNNGVEEWVGTPFSQLKRANFPDPSSGGFASSSTFLGAAYWSEENKYNKLDFDEIADASKSGEKIIKEAIRGGWISIIQHYFLTAWIPDADNLNQYYTKYLSSKDEYIVGSTQPTIAVSPGSSLAVDATQLYIGPKIQGRLEEVSEGLELAVDYGILFFISNILFIILDFIHGLTQNWGWAIILLTVLIKILFYIPSAMSYRSMANIRRIQPELLRIREKFSEDKQKLSQEMMKLYQKEKINPLGGCLPILLQMPVFIALYWTLLESVELRQADFIFWIKDLSSMDQYFVLPLLMGASMFVQTSLNPTPPDPMQAKVMKFMPVIFTVFFLFFPSGLVLYWLTNNILSIAQQWWITKGIEKESAK